jgi:hypothetical protein
MGLRATRITNVDDRKNWYNLMAHIISMATLHSHLEEIEMLSLIYL